MQSATRLWLNTTAMLRDCVKLMALIGLVAAISFPVLVPSQALASERCAGVDTSYIKCNAPAEASRLENTGFWWLLSYLLGIAISLAGVVGVGGVVWGAIMYASAGDNESQAAKAKVIIRDVIIGFVAFAGMYVILEYAIPGGVF